MIYIYGEMEQHDKNGLASFRKIAAKGLVLGTDPLAIVMKSDKI